MTQHFRPPGIVAISLGTWNGLSAEQQAVMTEEAAALQDYEIQLTAEVGAAAVEELKTKGMEINEADVAAFRERMGGRSTRTSSPSKALNFWRWFRIRP